MKQSFQPILFFSLLATSCLAADSKPKGEPQFPADVRVERSVAFLPEGRKEKADLYFPLTMAKEAKLPAVVLIHGGGWVSGRRDAEREINIGTTLARNGYIAMSIDYLLSDKKQAVWPTNLWDCKTAVRWLRKNGARFNVDPERIGVIGGSAGGHLAAMVALTTPADGLDPAAPYGDVSCAVKCCVDLYGIADIGTYHDVTMLGKTFAEAPELYRRASPVTYVRSNSVPFLLLHGTADQTVNLEQSKLLARKLEEFGVSPNLVIVTNAPHTFHLTSTPQDLRPVVLAFLTAHLASHR
ncbi:MAG: hypothetical protein RLY20_1804 [Verrucomicrobiota bacterium]|jgi:acetyl esterase/lipase